MNSSPVPNFTESSRAIARDCAVGGLALLARAFNHCGNEELPYRFTPDVQSRFMELATELIVLMERGELEVNPTHGLYVKARTARSDKVLQNLLRKASQKTPVQRR